MSRKASIILMFLVTIMISSSLVAADDGLAAMQRGPLAQIEQEYRAGELTLDEKVLLQITAIRDRHNLPSKYQALAASTDPASLRGVTPVLAEIRSSWDLLSDETRRTVTLALTRVGADSVYVSPSGYYLLHYSLSPDPNAVPGEDLDGNEVPDFVEKCAAYCDSSMTKHQELGYRLPPSDGGAGGDEKFDVYFQNMAYYGYAVLESYGPEPWNDYISYLVLNNNFEGFPPNQDPEGDVAGAAKATAAHEFHHCVQFSYDGGEGLWIMELDATWMEDIVFDHSDDNYGYLPSYFDYPQTSLMHETGSHPYGSFIWHSFLAEKFDTSLMVSIWEGARYDAAFDVLSDTLSEQHGWTPDSAMAEFAVWNYCTDIHDDGEHYEEASSYPLVSVGASHSTYPISVQNSPAAVGGYAAAYVAFYPDGELGKLRVVFNGSDSREWAVYIIKSTAPDQHQFEKAVLNPEDFTSTIEVPEFSSYQVVTLVGINISEFSEGALFTYSAEVIPPYDMTSRLLPTEPPAIYSGASRDFECQAFNTSILLDVFNFIVWDDLGWIPLDTIARGVYPEDSVTVPVSVHPPQGTAFGTQSTLYFKVESPGDPTISQTHIMTAEAVMQRGDVDFSGQTDVADIVYLVNYSFHGGSAPVPTQEVADFDCSGQVDVADLVAYVGYAFHGGPDCPCRPY